MTRSFRSTSRRSVPVLAGLAALAFAAACGVPCLGDGPASEVPVTALLGPDGGYLCTSDAIVFFPEGALADETEISLRAGTAPPSAEAQGVVGPVIELGPSGLTFSRGVIVTLRTDEGDAVEDLTLFSESDGQIEELSDVYAEPAVGTVSGTTRHFSTFYAAAAPPAGGPGSFSVGGDGLSPLWGTSASSDSPPQVGLWVTRDGISDDPYRGPFAENLTLVVDTGLGAGQRVFVQGWTVDPVDPGAFAEEIGERISVNGFWNQLFQSLLVAPLRDGVTDANGRITVSVPRSVLYGQLVQAPAGYSSGRVRIRVLGPDAASGAVDVYVSLTAWQ